MDVINGTNYLTAFGENIFEVLKTVSDPTGIHNRQFVYRDGMPDVKSAEFDDYPFIVLQNYGVEDINWSVDRSAATLEGSAEIHILQSNDSVQDKQRFEQISQAVTDIFIKGIDLNEVKIIHPRIERNQRFPARDEADEKVLVREIDISCRMQVVV